MRALTNQTAKESSWLTELYVKSAAQRRSAKAENVVSVQPWQIESIESGMLRI